MSTIHIRISEPTDNERGLLNLLTPDERLRALLDAARAKAHRLVGSPDLLDADPLPATPATAATRHPEDDPILRRMPPAFWVNPAGNE